MKSAAWMLHSVQLAMAFAVGASLCAYAQAPDPHGSAPDAEAPSPAGPAAAPASRPRPYMDLLKDAKAIPGLFALHQKDEKVWLEIRPEQFDLPFFFAYNIPSSIGERDTSDTQVKSASGS